MAKIFKIGGYIVDTKGYFDANEVAGFLSGVDYENYPGTFAHHIHVEEAEFECHDELSINKENCDLAYCEEYFKGTSPKFDCYPERALPKSGEIWRHFKEGKTVAIIAISKNSEFPDQALVTYECPNGVYTRPLDMFMSKTDREKYPDTKQEWRFERVEDQQEWM